MALLNQLKLWVLIHGINNISDEKLVDMIEDYQKKEFGEQYKKAVDITANKLISVGLQLKRRA